jgi:hypothetical protein
MHGDVSTVATSDQKDRYMSRKGLRPTGELVGNKRYLRLTDDIELQIPASRAGLRSTFLF